MEKNKIVKYENGQLQKFNRTISLTNKLLGVDYRNLFVVHLDDHRIFKKGMKFEILKILPNIQIEGFLESESALFFVNECLQKGKRIDLIITDYNHPGRNGLLFAKKIREIESSYSIKIPIILLTMREGDEILANAVKEEVLSSYCLKNIQLNELGDIIKNITIA